MDTLSKARFLAEAGTYDSCGPKACQVNIKKGLGGIYSASAEHESCRMFKTLMSNRCIHDCRYCVNRAGCAMNSVSFEPDELARLQMKLKEEHGVNALFLSSAVTKDAGGQNEKMLEALRLLRQKYHFQGYIHLKVLPGTSREHIRQGSEPANRMSINIEAPSKHHLHELSTTKDYYGDILKRQRWISRMLTGQSTQLIITGHASDRAP